MRMMLKVHLEVEASNQAIQNGTLPKLIEATLAHLKPEAAYFLPDEGKRSAYFFFDMKDPSEIPPLVEPWFALAKASVSLCPVMNAEDVRTGLQKISPR